MKWKVFLFLLLLLTGCSGTTIYLGLNLQERGILQANGYAPVGGEEWMIESMMKKSMLLQAGRYQVDIVKVMSNKMSGRAYAAHIWLWPYVANNLGVGRWRHHLEVYRIPPVLTLPEIIRSVNERVSQIEATYITYGLLICTHDRTKEDGIILLTPECYLKRLDSLRTVQKK